MSGSANVTNAGSGGVMRTAVLELLYHGFPAGQVSERNFSEGKVM